MEKKDKDVYRQIAETEHFQNLLETLPKEERVFIETSLKELCDNFVTQVIEPLERLQTD